MTEELLSELLLMTMQTIGLLVAPTLIVVVAVGILVNILQTITQIRDPAIAFVPKVIAAAVVVLTTSSWGLQILRGFAEYMMELVGRGVF